MSKNKFDDLLLKKFQEEELEYQAESWNKLAQKLPKEQANKKRRLFLFPIGIAAAIALVLGSVLLFNYSNTDIKNAEVAIPIAKQKVENNTLIEAIPEEKNNNQNQPNHSVTTKITNTITLVSVIKKDNADASRASKNTENAEQYKEGNELELAKNTEKVLFVHQELTGNKPQSAIQYKEPNVKINGITKPNNNSYPNSEPEYWAKNNNRKETSIGVAGGVNYGSLNAGYAVGLSAKQGLGKDFFIDGTIAVMYNNNANNLGNYAGKTSGRPATGAITMASPAFSPTQNLYYVQFNPSFGYQVEKDVALSMGADVQKLVSNDEHTNKVKFTQNGLETIPNVDFGFTAKAEISVGPNIKTGVIYREGLNSLLDTKDISYVNRRYFQVQFKYNIPLK